MDFYFNPSVNPPGGVSYAAPLVNFGALAEMPNDAFQATQRAQMLQLQAPVAPLPSFDTDGGR